MAMKARLNATQRNTLIQMVMNRYESDKEAIERALPDIAEYLGSLFPESGASKRRSPFRILTELEKRHHLECLSTAVQRLQRRLLSPDEAVTALESGVALLESGAEASEVSRKDLIKLLRTATGLSLSTKGKPMRKQVRAGEPAKYVNIIRGVKLHLTSDTRLLSVEVNPKELNLRNKALRFVGMGHDTATDVALHHDKYFVDAVLEQ